MQARRWPRGSPGRGAVEAVLPARREREGTDRDGKGAFYGTYGVP